VEEEKKMISGEVPNSKTTPTMRTVALAQGLGHRLTRIRSYTSLPHRATTDSPTRIAPLLREEEMVDEVVAEVVVVAMISRSRVT
jgi:hypothetical protein